MTELILDIDLAGIRHNSELLSVAARGQNIKIIGVVKGVLGDLNCVRAMAESGINCFGDASIDNLRHIRESAENIRATKLPAPIELILLRQPLPDELDRTVRFADAVFVWNEDCILELDRAVARNRADAKPVYLVVDMGQGREGMLPSELPAITKMVHELPNLELLGVAITLNCEVAVQNAHSKNSYDKDVSSETSSQVLSEENQATIDRFTELIIQTEAELGIGFSVLSGGNSGAVELLLERCLPERINQLRIGEAILLGRSTVTGIGLDAFKTGNFSLSVPVLGAREENGDRSVVLGIGKYDLGAGAVCLSPDHIWPSGMKIKAQASDHLVIDCKKDSEGAVLLSQADYGSFLTVYPDYYGLLGLLAQGRIRKRFFECDGSRPTCIQPEHTLTFKN